MCSSPAPLNSSLPSFSIPASSLVSQPATSCIRSRRRCRACVRSNISSYSSARNFCFPVQDDLVKETAAELMQYPPPGAVNKTPSVCPTHTLHPLFASPPDGVREGRGRLGQWVVSGCEREGLGKGGGGAGPGGGGAGAGGREDGRTGLKERSNDLRGGMCGEQRTRRV